MSKNVSYSNIFIFSCSNNFTFLILQKVPTLDTTVSIRKGQCWTKGRRSTAVAEDFRPKDAAMVVAVWGHSFGRRSYL